jgi:hypothetical protein
LRAWRTAGRQRTSEEAHATHTHTGLSKRNAAAEVKLKKKKKRKEKMHWQNFGGVPLPVLGGILAFFYMGKKKN